MPLAFLSDHRQERLERTLQVGAVLRLHAVCDDEQAPQAEHMVEPDRARMAHGRAEHPAERRELPRFQSGWTEAR